MARVKRGVTAHRRHKRLLNSAEGRKGTNRSLVKRAHEAQLHALAYATRDLRPHRRGCEERLTAAVASLGPSTSPTLEGS